MEKAYFVDTESEIIYELSESRRKKLEKTHPQWFMYVNGLNLDEQLNEVHDFFKKYGKVLARGRDKNIFVGVTP